MKQREREAAAELFGGAKGAQLLAELTASTRAAPPKALAGGGGMARKELPPPPTAEDAQPPSKVPRTGTLPTRMCMNSFTDLTLIPYHLHVLKILMSRPSLFYSQE